jgi:hypothetical protein
MRNASRRISFLIAEKSMKRKYIGLMARALNASKLFFANSQKIILILK